MKKMPLLPLLAMIVLTSPALAADLPIYAIDDHCQGIWRANSKMRNVCVQQQQASRDALQTQWASISAKIAQYCRGEWDRSNDYMMLQFCVEEQSSATRDAAASTPN